MVKFKRKDTRIKFKEFLGHLDSNFNNLKKRDITYLRENFSNFDNLIEPLKEKNLLKK